MHIQQLSSDSHAGENRQQVRDAGTGFRAAFEDHVETALRACLHSGGKDLGEHDRHQIACSQ